MGNAVSLEPPPDRSSVAPAGGQGSSGTEHSGGVTSGWSVPAPSVPVVSPNTDEFLDLLASSQSRRLDDQRASFSNLPGLRLTQNNNQSVLGHLMTDDSREPDEDFFDILVKCQVCGYGLGWLTGVKTEGEGPVWAGEGPYGQPSHCNCFRDC